MHLADPARARLQASINADREFRLAARYWNATLSLESPPRALRVEIAEGQALAAAVPGATFRAMPDLGHFPMCENPVRFREHILPVLHEIRTRHSGR